MKSQPAPTIGSTWKSKDGREYVVQASLFDENYVCVYATAPIKGRRRSRGYVHRAQFHKMFAPVSGAADKKRARKS